MKDAFKIKAQFGLTWKITQFHSFTICIHLPFPVNKDSENRIRFPDSGSRNLNSFKQTPLTHCIDFSGIRTSLEERCSLSLCSYSLLIRWFQHKLPSANQIWSSQSCTTDLESIIPTADTIKRLHSETHLQLQVYIFLPRVQKLLKLLKLLKL